MSIYRVIYLDGDKQATQDVVADSEADVMSNIGGYNVMILEIKKVSASRGSLKVKKTELIQILSALADLLKSGMSLPRALDTIVDSLEEAKAKNLRNIFLSLRDTITNGKDLSTGMESHVAVFGLTVASMVKAGEYSGKLPEALDSAADYLKTTESIKKEAISKMSYPLFILFVGLSALFANSFFIIPKILESELFLMVKDQDESFATTFLKGVSTYMPTCIIVFIAACVFFFLFYKINQNFCERILLKVGFIKKLMFYRAFYTSFYSLSKLIDSGVRIDHSLAIIKETVQIIQLKKEFSNALEKLRNGEPFLTAFSFFSPVERAILAVSSDTDKIVYNLNQVANRFYENYVKTIQSLSPKIYGVVLLLIGSIFIIMFLGILIPYSKILGSIR